MVCYYDIFSTSDGVEKLLTENFKLIKMLLAASVGLFIIKVRFSKGRMNADTFNNHVDYFP